MIGTDKYEPQTAMKLAPRADWLEFADVEEQALALAGWNQNYLQLSAGTFQGQICQLEGQGIKLFIEHVQQSMLQTGELPNDVLALGIPLETSGNGMFSGQTCGASDLHVFSGASGFEFRPSHQHTMLGIEIQMGKGWTNADSDDCGASSGNVLPAHSCALHMEPSTILGLKNYLLTLFQSAHDKPSLLANPVVVANIADHILDRIAPIAQMPKSVSAACSHWQLVQHACCRVNEASDQTLTVAQLCQSLGVSRRTLQTGFQQVLDISPLAYVKAYRLAQARKALKATNSVTEAATSCGFWHFGHFSHDYRTMFGEYPSDTLRRHALR